MYTIISIVYIFLEENQNVFRSTFERECLNTRNFQLHHLCVQHDFQKLYRLLKIHLQSTYLNDMLEINRTNKGDMNQKIKTIALIF